jgi:prepilin-type N-terminal cleavage/methylation domain-containing protein
VQNDYLTERDEMTRRNKEKGFSLLELLVALAILLIVSGTIITGMIRMTWSQYTIMNRTQVHSSVRNATEMMQQEIGQAGRVGSSPGLKFQNAIATVGDCALSCPTITSSSGTATDGLYIGEQLIVDPNTTNEETVTIVSITGATIRATFANTHVANTPVLILGGFVSGIVPPTGKKIFSGVGTNPTTLTAGTSDGSDGYHLKLYGDIYGDGNMYYVEYVCAPNSNGNGTLKRYNVQDVINGTAATLGNSGAVLLDTLAQNPPTNNPAPCFTYSTKDVAVTINGGQVMQTFVVNVAVTLTVQTQSKDMQTGSYQTETKALLNVAPRNVVDAWELASAPAGYTRAQPMPGNVLNLLTATLY